jgi:hypothetical protein
VWFLFHHKGRTRTVADGRSFTEECPTCQRTTRFDEVEVSDSYGVWFVDVIGNKERAFKCRVCGDTFDLRDEAATKPATRSAPAPKAGPGIERDGFTPARGMDRVEALAAEQRKRDADSQARRAQIETRLDDELAELKRRMGK